MTSHGLSSVARAIASGRWFCTMVIMRYFGYPYSVVSSASMLSWSVCALLVSQRLRDLLYGLYVIFTLVRVNDLTEQQLMGAPFGPNIMVERRVVDQRELNSHKKVTGYWHPKVAYKMYVWLLLPVITT